MKLSVVSLVLSVASVAFAQDTTGLPQCSLSCFTTAIQASGCALNDTVCQCTTGKAAVTANVTPCILKSCTNPSDQAAVETAATNICQKALASASASGGSTPKTTKPSNGTSPATLTSSSSSGPTGNSAISNKAEMVGAGVGFLAAMML